MKLLNVIHQFYYEMTLGELRQMNGRQHYPRITYNSLLYLFVIANREKMTVSDLAELLQISKSAVTIKVNELVKRGFVKRTVSSEDKRIKHLSLTSTVKEEFNVFDETLFLAVRQANKKYSKKEIDVFCEMLLAISRFFSNT